MKLKLLCQNLCKKHLGWDEELDDQSKNIWMSLQQELKESQAIKIPRCYFEGVHGETVTASLEGFCYASVDAYAAVVYLKLEATDGVHLRLVTSKTRVAPLVKQTIPRLELLLALILGGLVTHVKKALTGFIEISSVRCWSYFEIALHWIFGETHEWKQFVQNKVLEIRSLIPPELWNHCPSKDNPADIPSRGTSPRELLKSMWFTGPEWLKTYNEPIKGMFTEETKPSAETLEEIKTKVRTTCLSDVSSFATVCAHSQVGMVVDC